ncbi:MAG: ribosome biogenesis GTPase YlqF [Ruminococcaceae bacterium]|nr:ribosome biogenesis GTPase YlqF [Oscillospiraceae bacterium]
MPSEIIQWFPGHMARTRREIGENLKNVDFVIELLDARIPLSSQNPEIARICGDKPRLTLCSRASLADPKMTKVWKAYFAANGRKCIFYDCITGEGMNEITLAARELLAAKLERYREKGMEGRKLRAMIVGIPNVGKSSIINKLSGTKSAKVENRPGVTRKQQWIPTNAGFDLLDTPGVLWPKFEDPKTGENLAVTGAIKDDILDIETLASILVNRLRALYPDKTMARYKLKEEALAEELSDFDVLERIGKARGFLVSGGEIDLERTAKMLLEEFRSGKIGRMTIDLPPENGEKENA